MTTTPAIWLDEFLINTVTPDIQTEPVITGLANGNILVTWTDHNDTVAPGNGSEIMGAMFDALGNLLAGWPRVLNDYTIVQDERDPAVAARNDGGFVLVYETAEGTGLGRDVIFEIFNAGGVEITDGRVADGISGGITYRDPSIAMRSDNSFVVSYESGDGNEQNVFARVITATGTVGSELILRSDLDPTGSTSDPIDPDSATLTNDVVVTTYLERDGTDYDVEVRAVNADGTVGFLLSTVTTGSIDESDPHIAALTGGNFVVIWNADGDILGKVFTPTGSLVGGQLSLATGADNQNEPDVIGLEDGGFVVVWDDDTDNSLEGRRFNDVGARIGNQFTITNDSNGAGPSAALPELSLTSDGRILVTWRNGEIYSKILDPRESTMTLGPTESVTTGTQQSDSITATRFSANKIFGVGGDDTIDGYNGTDYIDGGEGNDSLLGGNSVDTIVGGTGNDIINGGLFTDFIDAGQGNDIIIVEDGHFFDDVDGGDGFDVLDHSDSSAVYDSGSVFDFSAGTITSIHQTGTATLRNIERFLDGQGGNTIIIGGPLNNVDGGGGNDTIQGTTNLALNISGGSGNDSLSGSTGVDLINGGIGNDFIDGGNSTNDTLLGGIGNDTIVSYGNVSISGGEGDDTFLATAGSAPANIDGGTGTDLYDASAKTNPAEFQNINLLTGLVTRPGFFANLTNVENVIGTQGDDFIYGNTLSNDLQGAGGNDTIDGHYDAQNTISGGSGNDSLLGGDYADLILGGDGGDYLSGGDSFGDTLRGGNGNDTLEAFGGGTVEGNGGNDTFVVLDTGSVGVGGDTFSGGTGIDLFDASNETSFSYFIDLLAETVMRADAAPIATLIEFENVVGGQQGDVIIGNANVNKLFGIAGDDSIDGGAGNDTVDGGEGADTLLGGIGNDSVIGGAGNDDAGGGIGHDTLFGFGGNDTLMGNEGNDLMRGNLGNDVVWGNDGNDTVTGGAGNDSVYGGANNDYVSGGTGDDLLDGGAGFDIADFSYVSDDMIANINLAGAQVVSSLEGTDTFVSVEGLLGGSGNDLLVGNAGGNVIEGGAGNDEIYGIGGGDILRGGSDDDQIEGSGGNDTMEGGTGDADVLSYFNAAGGVKVDLRHQGTAQAVGGSSGTDTFTGFEDIYGANAGSDILIGDTGDNRILGFGGGDLLFGIAGADELLGMQGMDTLNGGLGEDTLTGGGGADVFKFNTALDSTFADRDIITDFDAGGAGTVDLSTIDANSGISGNQAFNFIGGVVFTSNAGELRFATDGTDGYVLGDVDGDGAADLNILLHGVTAVNVSDFIF